MFIVYRKPTARPGATDVTEMARESEVRDTDGGWFCFHSVFFFMPVTTFEITKSKCGCKDPGPAGSSGQVLKKQHSDGGRGYVMVLQARVIRLEI